MDPHLWPAKHRRRDQGPQKKVTSWKFTSSPWKDPPIFFRKVNHLFRLGPSKNHGKLLVITSGKIPRSLGFFRPNPSGKCAQTSVIPFPPSTGSQFSPGSCPRNVSQERAQRHGMVFFNLKCWLIMVNQP